MFAWAGRGPQEECITCRESRPLSISHHLTVWSIGLSLVGMAASMSACGVGSPAERTASA